MISRHKSSKHTGAGRPAGAKTANAHEKIHRSLGQIYDAIRKGALAGDAAAARLCFDILRNPKDYPLPRSSDGDE